MDICLICDKEFSPLNGSKTCSGECRKEWGKRRQREWRAGKKMKLEPQRCPWCLRFFTPRFEGQITCSSKCNSFYSNKESSEYLATSKAIGWSLGFDPFAHGMVRMDGGRMPDAALGF